MRFLLVLCFLWCSLDGAAQINLYAAQRVMGRGTGLSPEDAVAVQDARLWAYAAAALRQQPVTVHLLGEEIVIKGKGLRIEGVGNAKNLLTITAATTSGIRLRLEPISAQQELNMIHLEECLNVRIAGLHFTGSEEMGYALQLRNCQTVIVESCSWVDMPGVYYGATGTSHDKTRKVLWRNCLFQRVGQDTHCHMIYNAYGAKELYVESCWFEDCSGEFIRFRDETDHCVVQRCTFKVTGNYKSAGPAFISVPLFNDDNPAEQKRGANYEYFGTNFTIADNLFEYPEVTTKGNRVAFWFLHSGFDPPGRRHLLSASEAEMLKNGTPEQRKQVLLVNAGIDVGKIKMVGNKFVRVDMKVGFSSKPNYGAVSKGWAGVVDVSGLFGE